MITALIEAFAFITKRLTCRGKHSAVWSFRSQTTRRLVYWNRVHVSLCVLSSFLYSKCKYGRGENETRRTGRAFHHSKTYRCAELILRAFSMARFLSSWYGFCLIYRVYGVKKLLYMWTLWKQSIYMYICNTYNNWHRQLQSVYQSVLNLLLCSYANYVRYCIRTSLLQQCLF